MSEARPSKNRAWWNRSFLSLILLGSGIVLPAVLLAQSQQTSLPILNEQQRAGKDLFLQNCSYCHLQRKGNPKIPRESPAAGPTKGGAVLSGLFRGAAPDREPVVRQFVLQGTPKMPGFQYALEPKELDDLMAYLKTL